MLFNNLCGRRFPLQLGVVLVYLSTEKSNATQYLRYLTQVLPTSGGDQKLTLLQVLGLDETSTVQWAVFNLETNDLAVENTVQLINR